MTQSHARFTIQRSTDNQYYVNLKAANAQILITTETYASRATALNAISSIQDNASNDARYDRLPSQDAQHYFVLRAGNGQVLATSETYATRAARDAGIETVKRVAATAQIEG